jgi:hypothetical protein
MNAAGGKSSISDNNKVIEDDLTSDDSDTLFQAYQVSLFLALLSSGKIY